MVELIGIEEILERGDLALHIGRKSLYVLLFDLELGLSGFHGNGGREHHDCRDRNLLDRWFRHR